jgi:hypothetical protein
MDTKNWWESKIFWVMVLQFLISALGLAQEFTAKGDYSIPAIIGMVIAILVVVLRVFFTSQPIKAKVRK